MLIIYFLKTKFRDIDSVSRMTVLLSLAFVIFFIFGAFYYSNERKAIRLDKLNELSAVSDSKIGQLMEWQKDHFYHANYLSKTEPFAQYIREIVKGDSTNANLFKENLISFIATVNYESILFVNSGGAILLESSSPNASYSIAQKEGQLLDSFTLKVINQVFVTAEFCVNDFLDSIAKEQVCYSFLFPVIDQQGNVIAAMVFLIDISKYILPIVSQWTKFYSSSESMLARREFDSVRLMVPTRNRGNVLFLKSSMVANDRLSFRTEDNGMGTWDSLGFYSGLDYDKREIIAKYAIIPGTKWYLIEKIYSTQIFNSVSKKSSSTAIAGAFTFLLSLAALLGLHLNKKRELKQSLLIVQKEELRKSEQRYRSFFYEHSAIKMIIDPFSGRIVEANDSAVKFYGWSMAQLKKMSVYDLTVLSSEEIAKLAPMALSYSQSLFEVTQRKADGKLVDVEIYTGKVFIEEKPYIYSIIHDVTLRKYKEKSQEILHNIVRSSMGPTTLEQLITIVKQGLSRLLDVSNLYIALYVPEKHMLRKEDFNGNRSNRAHWIAMDSLCGYVFTSGNPLLLSAKEVGAFVLDHNLVPPHVIPECWLGVPLISQGNAMGVIVLRSYNFSCAYDSNSLVLMDMVALELSTAIARSQLIKDLILEKEKAQESNRLKSAFLANLSHEIRTPMNSILGFMDILSNPDFKDEQKDVFIEQIKLGSDRLMETLNNLVEASKIEANGLKIKISKVNVNDLLSNLLEHFKPQAVAKGISMKLDLKVPRKSSNIDTDEHKVISILSSLLINSLKFTKKGTIEIGNYIEGKMIWFFVNDTGCGINPDKLESVFNYFETANIAFSREHQGIGLGLSIVKSYVESLGGKIFIESKVGVFTSVVFCIPM